MTAYPVHIPRQQYRGSNATRRAKVARDNEIMAQLERHINARIEASPAPVQVITYGYIAVDTGYDVETVRRLCFRIAAGHNGFTVVKDRDAADELRRQWLRAPETQ